LFESNNSLTILIESTSLSLKTSYSILPSYSFLVLHIIINYFLYVKAFYNS
jgi:hypothetical protein